MSDSNKRHKKIGFSTGALEKGNYREALRWLRKHHALVEDIESLPIDNFSYVSFHAPSAFSESAEKHVVELLDRVFKRGWNIIVHPDVIRKPELWRHFGSKLLLENMDRRKTVARTADELITWFDDLPEARLCLDLAHARQLDTTLSVLTEIVYKFHSKIGEIHISELDSNCAHQLMSFTSVIDYRQVAGHFRPTMPIIIESMLDRANTSIRLNELISAMGALRHDSKHSAFYPRHVRPYTFHMPWLKQRTEKAKALKNKHFSQTQRKSRKRIFRLARAKRVA